MNDYNPFLELQVVYLFNWKMRILLPYALFIFQYYTKSYVTKLGQGEDFRIILNFPLPYVY